MEPFVIVDIAEADFDTSDGADQKDRQRRLKRRPFILQSALSVYEGPMTRIAPPSLPAFLRGSALGLAAIAACCPTASSAQSTATPPTAEAPPSPSVDTVRLTDEQRWAILNGNTAESAAAARGEMTGSERARSGIHGEVGATIGSRGTRGVYGTADIPLGENAGATVSFESSRSAYRRSR